MSSYVMYHCHSEYSLLDSCTKYQDYVDLSVKNGAKALSISEHGKPLNWTEKWAACKRAGIRYIHSVEIYLTESLEERVRDNYHTVLMAKNMAGVRELNALVSKSCDKEHFYYTNRISFDEFLGLSDNIISTSACLASPLNKLPDTHPRYMELARKYDFLEVQAHNHPEQIEFNKRLVALSKRLNKPLIAGTDTHSSSRYKAECRAILLAAKHKSYGDEDAFDLTYKTYDELVEMFRLQGALSEDDYMAAIENTNLLYDLTEDIELDTSIKYPILYGSRETDSQKFVETVERKFREKLESGIIPREQEAAFRTAIDEEMRVFQKLQMDGFMLSMSELICWCKSHGMAIGTARGSVGGSRVAYVTDIIDLNPEVWHTVFSRFCNEDRKEIGDIDIDCVESDRPAIFKYITNRFGSDKTARVASFGTMQAKGVIDDVGRALAQKWNDAYPGNKENPWSLPNIAKIKSEFDSDEEKTKKKYPDLFYYFDGLFDTKISQSVHPAGMVISPITLADNFGVFDKDNENCLMLDMENIHDYTGLAKYDFLILKTVQVIRDTCRYLNKPYPQTHEVDWNDKEVWADMIRNPSGIFQFEGAFAFDSLRKFKPQSIFDMSIVTACIRPSGSSYRDALLARKPHKNPSEIIDKLLEDNLGYLIYQEDTIKFLQQVCGLSGSEADNIRRAIGRKQKDRLDAAMPSILDGYCNKSPHPREIAENEAKEFLQVIEDSASYQFGFNHSVAYCLLGYLCAYYRYYHPIEFITSFLNNAANEEDIRNGTAYANRVGIKVTMPKWGLSKSEYFFDKERNIIAKGLTSIKYMSSGIAEELYNLAHSRNYRRFVDLLIDLDQKTSLNTRQLDILIKLDFFSDFGNQRELIRITSMFYETFKKGQAKKISKDKVDGTPLEAIISKYAVGVTKSGGEAKSYTLLDVVSIMEETEDAIKAIHMDDLSDILKVRNFADVMGYVGYVSGKEEDRRKLYVMDVYPLERKKDGKQFGYSVITKSIGSGKDSRFTVFNRVYNTDPIRKGDIIYCKSFERDGIYYTLTGYSKIY
ncbi:MAG: DNA polymerase III subunit alpha [Lachnospiraceae bacterium]|nr:DNA polymerase III subunit alpha [Lachnospiraceae bacterium]